MARSEVYTAAGGVVVHDDRVLVLRDLDHDEVRLPKGHVDAGETDEQAAIREVGEESGYVALRVIADLGSQYVAFTRHGVHKERTERYFLMEPIESVPPIVPEARFEPIWLSPEDAIALLTFEQEREWIRRARAHPQWTQPRPDVLERLGVAEPRDVGGRLRRHWLVESDDGPSVLRRWQALPEDVSYELRVMKTVIDRGWPAPRQITEPIDIDGFVWCLFGFLEGDVPNAEDRPGAHDRGRLLARFHEAVRDVDLPQRPGWRRCEEILSDPQIDAVLSAAEPRWSEEVRILRWHLERARARLSGIDASTMPSILNHGDFAPWNLRYKARVLSGLLDFEASHMDHRIADFALSWRGRHDDVVHGYESISPLTTDEHELLTPVLWAWLIRGACGGLVRGQRDEWAISHLLRRSPLMGPDADVLPDA